MASDSNIISLRIEDVRAELQKVMDDARAVPDRSQVTALAGAKSGSASDFYYNVQWALNRAANSAQALMAHLEYLETQVHGAVEAFSGQEMGATSDLNSMDDPYAGMTPSNPGATSTTTSASSAKRGFE